MAYVRVTEKLLAGTKHKIALMRKKAEEVHASERIEIGTPIHKEVRAAVEAAAWELKPELRDLMPMEWTYKSDQCRLVFYDNMACRQLASSIETLEEDPIILPCKPSSYYDEMKIQFRHQSPVLRQWLAEEVDRERARAELKIQYDTVRVQVLAFLRTKTSLNAALNEMPELELYIPEEFMGRVRQPTAPRGTTTKAEAPEVEVDRDTLAALGIAHRIATAAE